MKVQYYLFLFFLNFIFCQNKEENCTTIFKINTIIQDYHYQPKLVDDSLSLYVFNTIIEKLDRERNVFLQSEYDSLSKHKWNIDNYILDKNCAFLNEIAIYYKRGLERKLKTITQLEKEKITFNTKDTLYFTKRENRFYKDEKGIKRILKKLITYETLKDITSLSQNKDSLKLHFETISQTSKIKIFDTYKCKILNLLKENNSFEEEIKNTFFKAFCNYFDPHTDYFSYDDKSSFLSGVNSSNSSLGLIFDANENDEIFVNEIIPGGSAFENEKIEIGDQVIKIKHNKDEYWVNCSSIDQISNFITSDNYKILEITFRKKNSDVFSARIEKKVMKAIENTAYSYVLNQKNNFGYLKIPSFYTAEYGSNTLSNDVAKEIIKLKQDTIKGLIIDLQYNGGGNVDEAIKLAGMFIDIGPIAVAVDNEKNQTILKDYNRGVLFNDPIVILVNGASASASELFANALQDYKRAIIMGNPSFGKATMQSIIPVEESNQNKDFINLTIQKFYRITGKSHQAMGIIPDISVPYLFEQIIPKENTYKTVLNNDEIITNTRFKSYNNDFSKAIENSKKRVDENPYFKQITNINTDIDAYINTKKDRIVLLNFDGVSKDIHETAAIFDKVSILTKEKFNFKIEKNSYDLKNIPIDSYSEKYTQKQIEEIQSSAIVLEALEILNSLIN